MVRFTLPRESGVDLDVLDVGGRRVKALASGDRLGPGAHEIEWDGATDRGDRAPEGIYFVRLRMGSVQLTRRVVRIAH
jgi:flagellar hook assembly protein FlgD